MIHRILNAFPSRVIGLVIGLGLFVLIAGTDPPGGLSEAGWMTVACALLMATWWVSEAIPIPATALLPLVLFPLLGVATIGEAASPFANPVIFLFLGGFLIAAALERCGLHRRMALTIIRFVGTSPAGLVGGFMGATAFLSMWVSNTATVVMMLPTALSVIAVAEAELGTRESSLFSRALLLGLAYAANVGGIGTLIGTPPNALLAGFMSETYGIRIGFVTWMMFAVPLVIVAVPLIWVILTRLIYPMSGLEMRGGSEIVERESAALGPMTRAEWITGIVTTLVAVGWLLRPLVSRIVPGISDAGIAIAGAVLLFAIPVELVPYRPALTWKEAEALPWGVLILFGGGLSLASVIASSGTAAWIGMAISRFEMPFLLALVVVTTVIVFLTELTSNTATTAAFLPILASIAAGLGLAPLSLALPAALAASCAFMMPVATPPNAIVYGSGHLRMKDMNRAGLGINILMIVIVDAVVLFVALPLIGN